MEPVAHIRAGVFPIRRRDGRVLALCGSEAFPSRFICRGPHDPVNCYCVLHTCEDCLAVVDGFRASPFHPDAEESGVPYARAENARTARLLAREWGERTGTEFPGGETNAWVQRLGSADRWQWQLLVVEGQFPNPVLGSAHGLRDCLADRSLIEQAPKRIKIELSDEILIHL